MEPATAGDSILQATLSPVITGLNHDLRSSWGASPRLYAYACFAGWAILGMRSLLGRIDFCANSQEPEHLVFRLAVGSKNEIRFPMKLEDCGA